MSDRIHLRADDRKTVLRHYRGSPVPAVRLRCHVLLLLDAGHPWALIAAVLFTSSATKGGLTCAAGSMPCWRGRRGGDPRGGGWG